MKFLKVSPDITEAKFEQIKDKNTELGLKSCFTLKLIKEEGWIYLYRGEHLKYSVYCSKTPPQIYNIGKGLWETKGEEITIEEFLKLKIKKKRK